MHLLKKRNAWYAAGLHFQCRKCGNCCSGPNEGYIWITKPEIRLLADFLTTSIKQLYSKSLKKAGRRTTIKEQSVTKDCIFLQKISSCKGCLVYSVRPNQCRTWPFWSSNLLTPNDWNMAARKCPGINQGRLYTFEEIESIRKKRKWF